MVEEYAKGVVGAGKVVVVVALSYYFADQLLCEAFSAYCPLNQRIKCLVAPGNCHGDNACWLSQPKPKQPAV